jgi:hypothetical protein
MGLETLMQCLEGMTKGMWKDNTLCTESGIKQVNSLDNLFVCCKRLSDMVDTRPADWREACKETDVSTAALDD